MDQDCEDCAAELKSSYKEDCKECGPGMEMELPRMSLVGMDAVALFPSMSGIRAHPWDDSTSDSSASSSGLGDGGEEHSWAAATDDDLPDPLTWNLHNAV